MKFSIGDQVVVITTRHLTGHVGEVVGRSMLFGTASYDVSFPINAIQVFEESELEYPKTDMSQGLKNWLGVPDLTIEDFFSNVKTGESKTSKCDCGGFKTFGSMSEENHSSWCSSRQTKVDASLVIEIPAITGRSFTIRGFKS